MTKIRLKSEEEIQIMAAGGRILKIVVDDLMEFAQEGVSLLEIDKRAELGITKLGGAPSFKRVKDYSWTTCLGVNDIVVHGVPTDYRLKKGDEIGIDCGVYYEGFHTDASWSKVLPDPQNDQKVKQITAFLSSGEKAMAEALEVVKQGNRIGHISQAIQKRIEGDGFSIVPSLTGHGVGRDLHEAPEIPGFLRTDISRTPEIVPGMVLAVEIIYNMGKPEIVYKGDDGWTIATQDGKISGLFEKTVAVGRDGVFVLT